jgi:hypothetical protein
MMAHPLALQLRNLQTMLEIGVDKNSTIMFPAPLMSTIEEMGAFLRREATAVVPALPATADVANPAADDRGQTGQMAPTHAPLVSASAAAPNGVSEQ